MTSNSAFAGVYVSSGRSPFTIALLDDSLDLTALATADMKGVSAILAQPDLATVCVAEHLRSKRATSLEANSSLYEYLGMMSLQASSAKNNARPWFKIDAHESFRALMHHKVLARRTLEGRIQRAAILYDQGLQLRDPMEFFEEITRYKLMQGILPLETIYSSKELDALLAAYTAWMTIHHPDRLEILQDKMVLIKKLVQDEPALSS